MNFGEQKIKDHLREMESLGGKYRRRMLHQICLLGVLVLVWAAAAGIAAGAGMIKGIIDQAPQVSLADLEPQGFATQIYDSQGNLTETLVMSGANREEASYEEFPEHLVQAFVSMEDRRFWEHNGIDLRSIMRAAAGILTGDYAGGGSTITQQLVKNNVLAGGSETSWGARLERMAAAGKSGTTTDNRDAWFVGFTPYYTAGIWTGFDDNNRGLSNTNYHKTIWKNIMDRIHEELPTAQFQPPEDVVQVSVCRKSGKLAVPGLCDHDPRGSCVYTEYFARGTEPQEVCDVHVSAEICSETGLLAGEYCPDRVQGVFMVVPQGETAVTDDSLFTMPSPCTVHGPGTGTEGESPEAETGSPGPAAGSSGLPAGSSGRSAGPGGVQENEGREETVSPWPME